MSERPDHPLLLPDELAALHAVGVQKRFLPGDRLVSIGDRSKEVFYLTSGVVAVEPTTAIVVTANRFIHYLETVPAVALALLRMQSRRLNEMIHRTMLGGRSVKARIAQRLIELEGRSGNAGVVELTQSDLAKLIDASREWTSKALGELRRDGAVETTRGKILILDHDKLRDALPRGLGVVFVVPSAGLHR